MTTSSSPSRARRLAVNAAGGLGRLVLLLAFVVVAATFLPTLLGYERYVLVGHSMEPTIHKGSLVFDDVVPVGDLRPGDVITYVPPTSAEPVTHRILAIEPGPRGERVFRTKGDNNEKADLRPFTLREPEQARVAFAIPGLGWLFIALADPYVRMLLLALPALLLALWAAAGVWRQGGELVAAERARAGTEAS
jgi:signal peptidase I